ncbi:hypothetical protein C8R41DRAFT_919837 [Lentinula lateritia]|uniref:Uncharacterized protein n=1 Tax=Lentinula lateritia TaxID=40482 RepID=A0ABQ8V2Q2_9AGAR|nr:hypothetical protein C8R41DRAFT_925109 [Lentinula lateritia]KAJ4492525.1 hypothetical protein C8R41DRAFT_919837 [Lentinula lateritia]
MVQWLAADSSTLKRKALSQPDGVVFDVHNIPDALDPEVPIDASVFPNDNRTRAALHAPTSKDWALDFDLPF